MSSKYVHILWTLINLIDWIVIISGLEFYILHLICTNTINIALFAKFFFHHNNDNQ